MKNYEKTLFLVISTRLWGDDYGTATALGKYRVDTGKQGREKYVDYFYPIFKTKESAENYIKEYPPGFFMGKVKIIEVPLFG